jgi:Flagellar biogenesis protein
MGFWDLIKSIIIMTAVIFAAFYATKFIAKTGSPGGRYPGGRNERIQLLSIKRLGKDSSVVMLEIEQAVYILGVGNQRVELIDKLPLSGINQLNVTEENQNRPDFAAILKKELGDRFKRLK